MGDQNARFDFDLSEHEREQMRAINSQFWFTQVAFRNATSPRHSKLLLLSIPEPQLENQDAVALDQKTRGTRISGFSICSVRNRAFSFEDDYGRRARSRRIGIRRR